MALTYTLINNDTEYAVTGCSFGITSINILDTFNGLPITEIGEGAFKAHNNLTWIALGSNITRIGKSAFEDCKNLSSVSATNTKLAQIEEKAFYNCMSLNFPIPETVQTIGKEAFSKTSITRSDVSIDIPDSVTAIGERAFEGCYMAPSLTIGCGVKTIGKEAFNGCSGLTTINFNATAMDDLTSYNKIFSAITNNITVNIGNTVTKIPDYLFYLSISTSSKINITTLNFEEESKCETIGTKAFYNCTSLTTLVLPDSVITVKNEAFWHCEALTEIVLPDNVTNLGSWAFQDCKNLTSITLGSQIESIDQSCFQGCTSLTTIIVDDQNSTYKSIDGNLYKKLSEEETYYYTGTSDEALDSLIKYAPGKTEENFTVPSTVVALEPASVAEAINLKSVTIPSNVKTIGCSAFMNCSALDTLTIEEGVTTIEYEAFYSTAITEIIIPNSVTSLAEGAFESCSSLNTAIIGDGIETLPGDIFNGCSNLTDLTLGESVSQVEETTFSGCTNLKEIFVSPSNTAYKVINNVLYTSDESKLIKYTSGVSDTPATEFNCPEGVETIGAYAFEGSSLEKVTFPATLTTIENRAFYYCANLVNLELPNSLTNIGESAFNSCSALENILIPESVINIGSYAFSYCYNLTKIEFNAAALNNLRQYDHIFEEAGQSQNLKVIIGTNVTKIPDYLFYSYSSYDIPHITTVEFAPDSLCTSIGAYAFSNCATLNTIELPDNIVELKTNAFSNCTNLYSLVLPNSITTIEEQAFNNCSNLTIYCLEETCPETWNENWNSSNCDVVWGITNFGTDQGWFWITLPEGENSITQLSSYLMLTDSSELVIPSSVGTDTQIEKLGPKLLSRCAGVTTLTISEGIKVIDPATFETCPNLTSITLPNSIVVEYITEENNPFNHCTQLTYAEFPIEVLPFINNTLLQEVTIKRKSTTSTKIPADIFKGHQTLKKITITDAFDTIEENAFAECTAIETIELPETLSTVAATAFEKCEKIRIATIPLIVLEALPKPLKNLRELRINKAIVNKTRATTTGVVTRETFEGCSSVEIIELSDDIIKISDGTFKDYPNLIEAILPAELEELGASAFENCENLSNLGESNALPNTLITIGENAFKNCKALATIILPRQRAAIPGAAIPTFTLGASAFADCTSLASIDISANYKTIPTLVFANCTALEELLIPSTVTNIEIAALAGCNSLKTLTIPFVGDQKKTATDNNQYPFGHIFGTESYKGCTLTPQYYYSQPGTVNKDTKYSIPDSLQEVTILGGENILYGAFYNCQNLETIILPEELTIIGEVAFYNCYKLKEITIPDNVKLISYGAFFNCAELKTVTLNNKVQTIETDAFTNCTALVNVNYKGTPRDWENLTIMPSVVRGASVDRIEHFDLVLYPFKTVYGLNNKTEYKNSFNYTLDNLEKIKADIATTRNIAHNIITPTGNDITCIKNYLKLKARVTTTKKVTLVEEAEILNNIYKAIYANFNARQIDFGEEIPYETIVSVIKNADYRIKEIGLEEPELSTCFRLANGNEELLSDADSTSTECNKHYNSLVRRNILAGKISAFEYDKDFISDYDKTSYPVKNENGEAIYQDVYPAESATITTIESHFDVGTAFANRDKTAEPDGLVLKENEVIQFRVPNFKTTKTYPAYVNYFIKLNSKDGSKDAIPATFRTLEDFMSEGNHWNDFVNNTKVKEILAATDSIITIENADAFKTKLNTARVFFKKSDEDFESITSYDSETEYRYLPINDDIFVTLNNWIKSQPSNELKAGAQDEFKNLEGIYRSVGVQEKSYGHLIDIDLKKYLPAYKFNSVDSNKQVLQNFYVQDTYDKEDIKVKSGEVTPDGLGQDASYQGLPKNGEYQLKDDEYLLINYTDAQKDASGNEKKTVINKCYYKGCPDGDIIRANFDLIDSTLYHNNHSYSKRDGFTFGGQQPEGMFTLGAEEQIEIREIVKVDLNEDNMYLYWTLNSDDPNKETNTFIFNEDYGEGTNNAYTLKEGEHLYYTNSKKQDLVYYGSGTLIVNNDPGITLIKHSNSGEVSEEEIMTNGLAAAIPWQSYSFSKATGLTIIENQYISLTEGDIISKIDGNDPVNATTMPEGSWNNWATINKPIDTVYRFAEDTSDSHLPPVVVSNLNWSVRSRLDFNMSKTIAQPLHSGDSLKVSFKADNDDIEPVIIKSTDNSGKADAHVSELILASINSNYTCQAATDTIDTTLFTNSDLDLKLKVSMLNTPKITNTTNNLLLNNYVNGNAKYTKFDFANLPNDPDDHDVPVEAFKLSTSIPEKAFGLLAVYYIKSETEDADNGAWIKAKDGDNIVPGLSFFNMNDPAESEKHFKEGLNIIRIESTVKQLEIYADAIKKSTVIFGTLDVVTGINPKLDYRVTFNTNKDGNAAKLDQLLLDFREMGIVDDFYYNVPIQHSDEIDLNPAIADDLLSNPLAWYDPNNVNRKFVISEIDADYLSTGITLTKASRV